MSYTWVLNIFQVDFCIWYKIGIQFILLHVDIQFFQCYLLKKLSPLCILRTLINNCAWAVGSQRTMMRAIVVLVCKLVIWFGCWDKRPTESCNSCFPLEFLSGQRELWHTNLCSFIQWRKWLEVLVPYLSQLIIKV